MTAAPRSSWTIALPVVVLPQPDSPTRASVLPVGTSKETPSTALKTPVVRCSKPRRIGKRTARFSTRRSGAAAAAPFTGTAAPADRAGVAAAAVGGRDVPRSGIGRQAGRRLRGQLRVEQAADAARRPERGQRRDRRRARGEGAVAARLEAAALEAQPERRHRAADRRQRAAAPGRVGQRLQQQPGVRMLGRGEEVGGLGHLDDLAGVHQRHPVGHVGDDGQVVGDEEQAHALLALQVLEQGQDLRLDRHVERRRRLVGDQEVGLGRERHGDHDALLLAAGEAKRILVDAPGRLGNPDPAEPFDRLGAGGRAAQLGVGLDRLDDLRADLHHRVEAGARLLEDHADAAAAHRPHPGLRQRQQVLRLRARPGRRRPCRFPAAGASAPAPSCSCRSPTRRPGRRSRRG